MTSPGPCFALDRAASMALGRAVGQASDPTFGGLRRAVSSGWGTLDGALFAASRPAAAPSDDRPAAAQPGLVRGAVHEWFGTGNPRDGHPQEAWAPPLFLLAHLASRAVRDASERGRPTHVLWIGRCVWPYPRALNGGLDLVEIDSPGSSPASSQPGHLQSHLQGHLQGHLLGFHLELREVPERFSLSGGPLFEHSLFVDPGSGPAHAGQRLWAIDSALRCPSVTAIVADGSGLAMAATRRLQLAAASAEALVLLARPHAEVGEVSAATTRWVVRRPPASPEDSLRDDEDSEAVPTNGTGVPRWRIELLRAKGSQGIR